MSDEAREAQAGEAAVGENQNRLVESEEQITKPAPKVKPQREKIPRKSPPGKSLPKKTDKQKQLSIVK